MKNTASRLVGAALACALITLTVASAASAQPTGPAETTGPTPTSEVTETSAPSETSTPTQPERPYVDGAVGGGIPIGHNQGRLTISCAAGAPRNLVSPDIDVSRGVLPSGDPRYWNLFFWLPGNGIQFEDIRLSFTCGGKRYGDAPVPRPATPGGDTGKPQVKHVPKGGAETGFGGTADAGLVVRDRARST